MGDTPHEAAFLVRYFPLDRPRLDESAVDEAFQTADASGLTLATLIQAGVPGREVR